MQPPQWLYLGTSVLLALRTLQVPTTSGKVIIPNQAGGDRLSSNHSPAIFRSASVILIVPHPNFGHILVSDGLFTPASCPPLFSSIPPPLLFTPGSPLCYTPPQYSTLVAL
ncbi:hypothetical protein J3F83DRAFT_722194 [Trichoderma novae-zelandiae]